HLVWRATFSQGYIFPSLLNLSIGAYAGSRYVNPDPDLKPEESDTFETGIRFEDNKWMLDATVFATTADNYIDHVFCQTGDPCLTPADKIYKNIGESSSHGLELSMIYAMEHLDIYNHLTWMKRKKEYEGLSTYKSGTPLVTGRLGVIYTTDLASYPFSVDLYSRYESNADEAELSGGSVIVTENNHWVTLNADLNIRLGEDYAISASLNNLTDRKYTGAMENLYAPERHIQVRFSAKF
ncbi:MAG: TonB-dependent receptor, partial [Gammaproteobacteria bacterium]|nr:TonB-dependent receptor [Gammaproteobacteria bacterium]